MRHVPSMPLLGLPVFDELADREADVSCDLAEQDGRNVSAVMKGHGRTPARIVSILLVRPTLPDLRGCEVFGRAPKWPSQFHWRHRIGRNQIGTFRP